MSIALGSEDLTIVTGGNRIGGWLTIRVSSGIERLPSGFTLELTELYPKHPVGGGNAGKQLRVGLSRTTAEGRFEHPICRHRERPESALLRPPDRSWVMAEIGARAVVRRDAHRRPSRADCVL
jgi:hypothetical protein